MMFCTNKKFFYLALLLFIIAFAVYWFFFRLSPAPLELECRGRIYNDSKTDLFKKDSMVDFSIIISDKVGYINFIGCKDEHSTIKKEVAGTMKVMCDASGNNYALHSHKIDAGVGGLFGASSKKFNVNIKITSLDKDNYIAITPLNTLFLCVKS